MLEKVKSWLTGRNILAGLWQIIFICTLLPYMVAKSAGTTITAGIDDIFVNGVPDSIKAAAVFMIICPLAAWVFLTAFRFFKLPDKISGIITGSVNSVFAILYFIFSLVFVGEFHNKLNNQYNGTFWFVLTIILVWIIIPFSVALILVLFKTDEDLITTIKGGFQDAIFKGGSPAGFCTKCGAPLKSGMAFCASCGAPVPAAPQKPTCPKCGRPLTPGTAFCTACGTKIEAAPETPAAEQQQ